MSLGRKDDQVDGCCVLRQAKMKHMVFFAEYWGQIDAELTTKKAKSTAIGTLLS